MQLNLTPRPKQTLFEIDLQLEQVRQKQKEVRKRLQKEVSNA